MRNRTLVSVIIAVVAGAGWVTMLAAFPVHETGSGVRSMGFANNVTALADDPSAAYWNPAGLSFSGAREAFAGFGSIEQSNTASVSGGDSMATVMRLRFSPAGVVYPVPVERGGLALSFSYSNPFNFDDMLRYKSRLIDTLGAVVTTDSDFRMYGGLDYWTAAGALQVAPGVGVGVAVSLVTGHENARHFFLRTVDGEVIDTADSDFSDRYERDYVGIDVRGGLLYRPVRNLRLGVRAVLPRTVSFTESVTSVSPAASASVRSYTGIRGKLISSFEGAVGAAYEADPLRVAVEIRGRLPYLLLRPIEDIPESSDASKVRMGFGCGMEFPVYTPVLIGRAGYSFDEYDTHRFAVEYERDDGPDFRPDPSLAKSAIHAVGAGFTVGFPQVSLDFGYRIGWWKLLTNDRIREAHLSHQAETALRWRF
jgi:hypothetical protein